MLDGLLGRGFSSKCKSWIKMTKTRLEVIMRRRNAMQKYLKKDIADLLANGLDTNAYSRAEGLLIELNLSFCYDFVAQICGTIPKHLSVMQKQRECPDDCREAISSLIFAAARFADLPELRHLRDIFTERYGTLEPFVNKEFVEKLSAKPPASEKKLQLMREIAKEFSINWDSKAIEQSVANSHLYAQNAVKIEEIKLHNSLDGITPKRDKQEVPSTGRQGLPPDGYILHEKRGETTLDRNKPNVNGRQGYSDDKHRLHSEGRETISEKVNQDVLLPRRREVGDDQYKQHNSSTETVLERGNKYDDGFKSHQTRAHTTWKKVNLDALSQKDYIGNATKTDKDSNDTILKRVNLDNSYNERRKNDNGHELLNHRENTARQQDQQEIRSYRVQNHPTSKPKTKIDDKEEIPFAGGNHKALYNSSVVTEEASRGAKSVKPLPPPPYVKPNGGKYTGSYASSDQANKADMEVLVNDRSVKTQTGLDHVGNSESKKAVGPVCGDEDVDRRDDNVGQRKPQSVRRRHLKPPAVKDHRGTDEGEEDARRDLNRRREVVGQGGTNEGDEVARRDLNRRREVVRQGGSNEGDEVVRREPNRRREVVRQGGTNEGDEVLRRDPNRRREVVRQGLQLALDNDHGSPDEEKIMDNLLIHYSKKPSKFGPPIKIGRSSNHPLGHHVGVDDNAPQMKRRNGVLHLDPEPVSPPPRAVSRAVSLPPEPAIPDIGRAPARATSFQPEMMNPGRHVHPRLPEYDDLAARIASLRSG